MPRIRQEQNFRHEAVTLGEAVDISTYDRVGRRGADALAVLSNSGERGEFLFLEGGEIGDTVTVAYLGGVGGQVQLKLSGYGSKGTHLRIGSEGVIERSSTNPSNELEEGELGIALGDWAEGSAVECDVFKI